MNAPAKALPAPAAVPSTLDTYMGKVLPPDKRSAIARSLPSHVPMARFERNLSNVLMQTPKLMKCDPRLVFREVSKIAALGLYCDPALGEAYLITGWNAREKREEPQIRIGYRGLMKLARQSGEIASLYAHEVYANDRIECHLGADKRLIHEPVLFGDRGPVIGYYAVVKYKGGETDFEPMTMDQIYAIRERSDGWKAYKAGRVKSTPWATDEEEMAKKTALRRLCKRIPQSPDLADAWKLEDAGEERMVDVTPDKPRLTAAQALEQMPADDAAQIDAPEDFDQSAGVPDAEPADDGITDATDEGPHGEPAPGPETVADLLDALPPAAAPVDPEEIKMAASAILQTSRALKTVKAIDNYIASKGDELLRIKIASGATYEHVMTEVGKLKAILAAR